jgi:hypothetical protein
MSLLIDGYNLLHAAGITGQGQGPGHFERSRRALLNFLAESIDPKELAATVVVFDAAEAPPGLPKEFTYRGISVRFAPRHSDADELIEQLIQADHSPRKLTVVSSDHRLQRAAHRRRAKAVDSDVWYAATLRERRERRERPGKSPEEPLKPVPASARDVEYWLREFDVEVPEENFSPFPPGYGEEDDDDGMPGGQTPA